MDERATVCRLLGKSRANRFDGNKSCHGYSLIENVAVAWRRRFEKSSSPRPEIVQFPAVGLPILSQSRRRGAAMFESDCWLDWDPDPERAAREADPTLEPFASMSKPQILDLMAHAKGGSEWEFLQEFFLNKCTPEELAVGTEEFIKRAVRRVRVRGNLLPGGRHRAGPPAPDSLPRPGRRPPPRRSRRCTQSPNRAARRPSPLTARAGRHGSSCPGRSRRDRRGADRRSPLRPSVDRLDDPISAGRTRDCWPERGRACGAAACGAAQRRPARSESPAGSRSRRTVSQTGYGIRRVIVFGTQRIVTCGIRSVTTSWTIRVCIDRHVDDLLFADDRAAGHRHLPGLDLADHPGLDHVADHGDRRVTRLRHGLAAARRLRVAAAPARRPPAGTVTQLRRRLHAILGHLPGRRHGPADGDAPGDVVGLEDRLADRHMRWTVVVSITGLQTTRCRSSQVVSGSRTMTVAVSSRNSTRVRVLITV